MHMNSQSLLLFFLILQVGLGGNLRTDLVEQISNGNFQNPPFTGTQFTTKNALYGWQDRRNQQIKFVKASAYNSLYPSSTQALAISWDSRVYQSRALLQKDWQLTFSVALSVNSLLSSYNFTASLKVRWNDDLIFDINPTTPSIQYIKTRVKSRNGGNTIQFSGSGNQDCDSIYVLVDDVSLVQIIDVKGQQIYAGLSGAGTVTFSTVGIGYSNGRTYSHNHYLLDYYFPQQPGCWSPAVHRYGQWIQISTEFVKQWVAVVIQGRNDDWWKGNFYVKKFKIYYTINGLDWTWAQNERIFSGNTQGITKQRRNFAEPIRAIGVRLYPTEWQGQFNLRFDLIFRQTSS